MAGKVTTGLVEAMAAYYSPVGLLPALHLYQLQSPTLPLPICDRSLKPAYTDLQ